MSEQPIEQIKEPPKVVRKRKQQRNALEAIRVRKATAKKIKEFIKELNKKDFGAKIVIDDLIKKLLTFVNQDVLFEIQEESLSNEDKLERTYQQYKKENPDVSKDEFLGILISKVPLQNQAQNN
tara:strand:+ start:262 stop:633 length:372 start_codon:yes stop_codon:yes gene_type:complete